LLSLAVGFLPVAAMPKSLLEQLPEIVARGRQQAEKILEGLEGRHRVGLQTREWVLPSRDTRDTDWIAAANRQSHLDAKGEAGWTNRLIYGDNLLAMAALLAGEDNSALLSSSEAINPGPIAPGCTR
jgi:adenine-specific DNA-methyltransferase